MLALRALLLSRFRDAAELQPPITEADWWMQFLKRVSKWREFAREVQEFDVERIGDEALAKLQPYCDDPALTARSTAASRQTKRFSDWAHSRASGCQTVSGKMGAGLQTVPCLHLPRERHANQGALVGRLDLAIRLAPPCTA